MITQAAKMKQMRSKVASTFMISHKAARNTCSADCRAQNHLNITDLIVHRDIHPASVGYSNSTCVWYKLATKFLEMR